MATIWPLKTTESIRRQKETRLSVGIERVIKVRRLGLEPRIQFPAFLKVPQRPTTYKHQWKSILGTLWNSIDC